MNTKKTREIEEQATAIWVPIMKLIGVLGIFLFIAGLLTLNVGLIFIGWVAAFPLIA